MTFKQLRKKYRRFVYERYEYSFAKGALHMRFHFFISPDIIFSPTIVINGVGEGVVKKIGVEAFNNFVFHLGMAEIPSYWKCACPEEIVIACGPLDAAQKAWWRSLIVSGLGEFFYTNHIDFTRPGFLRITTPVAAPGARHAKAVPTEMTFKKNNFIVPLGGGKDSLVTAELMKAAGVPFRTLMLGTAPALQKTAAAVGADADAGQEGAPITILRSVDLRLLALNKKGYLNGHTPFSAYLAFLTVFCAALFDYRSVAISQERSANEANVKFKGHAINHQYSKSFVFEKKFRAYAIKYCARNVDFFSAMRPLYELQIARLFSGMPRYFSVFKSCNVGSKKNVWCGTCPKCITIYALLSPFVPRDAVVKIFGRDVFANAALWPEVLALLGKTKSKPFECVGTKQEMMIALALTVEKYKNENIPPPALLARFARSMKKECAAARAHADEFLTSWDKNNFLPADFARILHQG